jgi:hypothetical protein
VNESKVPAWQLEKARVILNLYASLSERTQKQHKQYFINHPWLQVRSLSTSLAVSNVQTVITNCKL